MNIIDITQYFQLGLSTPDIILQYEHDLRSNHQNMVDIEHANELKKYSMYLTSNEFLNYINADMEKFVNEIAWKYPRVTFILKGRIKSMVRFEEKFLGYVIDSCNTFYKNRKRVPTDEETANYLQRYKDIVAYRVVVSIPRKNLKPGEDKTEEEIKILYDIANSLPLFFRIQGYEIEKASKMVNQSSKPDKKMLRFTSGLTDNNRSFFKDYIMYKKRNGYQSLHATIVATGHPGEVEIQLRTFDMDVLSETDENVNHLQYEKEQEKNRTADSGIPAGLCDFYDEARGRYNRLHYYDFTQADINLFKAKKIKSEGVEKLVVVDHDGVLYARQIDPREFLYTIVN